MASEHNTELVNGLLEILNLISTGAAAELIIQTDGAGGVTLIPTPTGGGVREVLTGFVDLTGGVKSQFNVVASEPSDRALALRFWISPKGANHGAATASNIVLRIFSKDTFSYAEYNTFFEQWNVIKFPSFQFQSVELSDAADEGDDLVQVDDITNLSVDDLITITLDGTDREFQAVKALDDVLMDLKLQNTILKPGAGAWPAGSEAARVFEISDQLVFDQDASLSKMHFEAEPTADCRLHFALLARNGS